MKHCFINWKWQSTFFGLCRLFVGAEGEENSTTIETSPKLPDDQIGGSQTSEKSDECNQVGENEDLEDLSDNNSIENEYFGLSQEALTEAQIEESRRDSAWKLYTILRSKPRKAVFFCICFTFIICK